MKMTPAARTAAMKAAIIGKRLRRSNAIETIVEDGRLYMFDHETGNQMCFGFDVYGQGYTESWSNRYGFAAHYASFKTRAGATRVTFQGMK